MRKNARRSAMKLVKTVYFKISKGKKDYFIKERSYASKFDGSIIMEFITEETFYRNLEGGRKIEFHEFENSPYHIKIKIEDECRSEVS